MRPNDPYQTQLKVSQRKSQSVTGQRLVTTPHTAKQTQKVYRKKKPVAKMMIFGAVSAAVYCLLFTNETLVTSTFTLGGWHAVFPVGAAFLFSFIHGAFASNLLSVLGLEPKKSIKA